jgi:hypothetical protein
VGKKFIASSLRATARLAEAQALEVSEQRREMEAIYLLLVYSSNEY